MAAVTSAVILETKKIKFFTVSIYFLSICHEVMGQDAMILVFWMLSFKPASLLSSFTFIKRLFSSSLLSAIRVVSSSCLKLLIFLQAILISAWASPILVFRMKCSAYTLNKQGDNMTLTSSTSSTFPNFEPVHLCHVLNVASCPAYRLLRRQVFCWK